MAKRAQTRSDRTLASRFWSKVYKTPTCWIWIGARARKQRGVLWHNGRNVVAPRVSWLLHNGEIPEGLLVCHTCDNPRCVRPEHLYLATHTENLRDASRNGLLATAKDGERNPMARLTEHDVREIRRLYHKGSRGPNGARDLANRYGVGMGWIRAIASGSRWNHVS